jgi:tetratricopeptide (TPR) repeat protein
MMLARTFGRRPMALACALLSFGLSPRVSAEPVLDRALAAAEVTSRNGCTQVRIGFNIRIRYQSHFPPDHGDELRINVRPLDISQAAADIMTRRESLRAPADKLASIKAIDLVNDAAAGPSLVIQFHKPVYYRVAQGSDFQSVVVAISGNKPSATCKPDIARRSFGSGWAAKVRVESENASEAAAVKAAPLPVAADRALTDADRRNAGAWMDEARAALKRNRPGEAVRLLTKILKLPENEQSAEALEFLGLAYQRGKNLDGSKMAYEAYLQRYPSGEGSDRVRQRLAGVSTATKEVDASTSTSKKSVRKSSGGFQSAPDGSPAWNASGSVSQFYIRDDSFHSVRDPSLPPNPNDDEDDHRVHQNVLLSSFDLIGNWSTGFYRSRIRFSGTEEHDFSGEEDEIVSVAALYYELAVRDWSTEVRLGRQTRNTGGVLGRFDGALLSWQASPWLRLNAVGGAPVEHRSDEPFKDDKYLFGASIDLGPFYNGLDVTLYAIEQMDRSWVDRQAIGGELRYISERFSGFATVDYDVHFNELNAAILSGSWTWPDRSVLNGAIEFRKSPFLSTWTALQGQPFLTLYDLLKNHTLEEVEQFARDRTTEYRSASLGYSRLLTENLQLNLDITATDTSGSPASGGVPEVPGTGTELYYSGQFLANNVLSEGDAFNVGLRLADLRDSNLYVLDLSARYPLTESWRIGPRLRLGYREGDTIDLTEYTVLPTVLIDYYWTKNFALELEAGANWIKTESNGATVEDTEFFFTFGYRYDFYADNQSACAVGTATCK